MSHTVTKRVRKSSKAKASALAVLLSIAEHAQGDGYSHPGNKLIAEESHISERSVERIVKSLSKRGDVYMKIGRGRGKYTKYVVTSGLEQEEIASALVARFGFKKSRAIIAAGAIVKRQKKALPKQVRTRKNPTELTTENPTSVTGLISHQAQENPTLLTLKPDTFSEKPDTFSEKPDTFSAPYNEVLEPCEPLEPDIGTHRDVPPTATHPEATLFCPKCKGKAERQGAANSEAPLVRCRKCGIHREDGADLPPKKSKARDRNGQKVYKLPPDEYTAVFIEAYVGKYGWDYLPDGGDLGQYRTMRARRNGELTIEKWRVAVENFIATPREDHRLKELCPKVAAFHDAPRDRFKVPIARSIFPTGTFSPKLEAGMAELAEWAREGMRDGKRD